MSLLTKSMVGMICLGLIGGFAAPTQASLIYEVESLLVSDDTWTHSSQPGPHGSSTELFHNVWLQWDLDSDKEIVSVDSATIRITVHNGMSGATLRFRRLLSPFDEDTLTHTTAPSATTDGEVFFAMPASVSTGNRFDVDVSSLLAGNGDLSTFGVLVTHSGGTGVRIMYSKELSTWPGPNAGARLTATYTVIPEPASVALLGLGLVAGAWLRRRHR